MKHLHTAVLSLALLALPAVASAQLVVVGKGGAAQCYQYAVVGNQGSKTALRTCDAAFSEALSRNDLAATYVNRGVLLMRSGDQIAATSDYNAALKINSELTEAHVNLGASLIQQERFEDAVTTLNTALSDETSETRPAALYNRAIAYDLMDNPKAAYLDLKAAMALKPDWQAVQDMLSRYTVVKRS